MGTPTHSEALYRSARAQALPGSPRHHAVSRKYAVGTSAIVVPLPVHDGKRPQYVKIGAAGVVLYGSFTGAAVVPTTSVDGSEQFRDGEVINVWNQESISLIAEGAGSVTLSFVWTLA